MRLLLLMCMLLAVAGCHRSTCDRIVKATNDFSRRCPSPGVQNDASAVQAVCSQGLAACSEADRKVLDKFAQCLEQDVPCSKDGKSDDAFIKCAGPLMKMDPACFGAVGMGLVKNRYLPPQMPAGDSRVEK